MPSCPKCGNTGVMHPDYEARFCPVHFIWLESNCGDPKCTFCKDRPEHAPEIGSKQRKMEKV
jgi:hypothetical protein